MRLTSVGFLTCFALACSSTLIFQCTPIAAAWDFRLRLSPGSHCFPTRTYTFIGLWNSIINIITDILFAVIPIPVVLKLKVNKRTKVTLIAVLSLGFVACVAGITKAHLQVSAISTPDAAFENSFQIWYMLELCLGILAASLPTLKPLFAAALDGTSSRLNTRSRSRTTVAVLTHASRLGALIGPNTFPEPADAIHLGHYKKGADRPVRRLCTGLLRRTWPIWALAKHHTMFVSPAARRWRMVNNGDRLNLRGAEVETGCITQSPAYSRK